MRSQRIFPGFPLWLNAWIEERSAASSNFHSMMCIIFARVRSVSMLRKNWAGKVLLFLTEVLNIFAFLEYKNAVGTGPQYPFIRAIFQCLVVHYGEWTRFSDCWYNYFGERIKAQLVSNSWNDHNLQGVDIWVGSSPLCLTFLICW